MSSHSLSLAHPDSLENTQVSPRVISSPPMPVDMDRVSYTPLYTPPPFTLDPLSPHMPVDMDRVSYTPLYTPPSTPPPHHQVIEIPDSPLRLPPIVAPVRQRTRRAPRRCSHCRQTGHDSRNCPERFLMNPRDNLTQLIYTRMLQRVPIIAEFPSLLQRVHEEIYFYVFDLSTRQLRTYLQNPQEAIRYAYQIALAELTNYEQINGHPPRWVDRTINRATTLTAPRRPLGSEYSKNIVIDLQLSSEEISECDICFDKKCHVKTGCDHLFCSDCVIAIMNENKNKTKSPICSFCREPFTKFTVSSPSAHAEICEFIQNLA